MIFRGEKKPEGQKMAWDSVPLNSRCGVWFSVSSSVIQVQPPLVNGILVGRLETDSPVLDLVFR